MERPETEEETRLAGHTEVKEERDRFRKEGGVNVSDAAEDRVGQDRK